MRAQWIETTRVEGPEGAGEAKQTAMQPTATWRRYHQASDCEMMGWQQSSYLSNEEDAHRRRRQREAPPGAADLGDNSWRGTPDGENDGRRDGVARPPASR